MPSAASPQAEESCSSKSLSKSEQATKALAAISISIGGVNGTALQEFDALAKTSPIKDL
jgi:hypothetical protein